jgi:hypothetical protein
LKQLRATADFDLDFTNGHLFKDERRELVGIDQFSTEAQKTEVGAFLQSESSTMSQQVASMEASATGTGVVELARTADDVFRPGMKLVTSQLEAFASSAGLLIPQRYLSHLQPIFHNFHLNLASIPVIVKPLPQPSSGLAVRAQARGWVIVVDPNYLAGAADKEVYGTIAHEATHVAQFQHFGSRAAMNTRYEADVARYGKYGQYDVSDQLRQLNIGQINPVDPHFPLESIADRVKDIAYEAIGL